MEYRQFCMQMDRLRANYGEEYYREERVKQLWKKFGELEYVFFNTGITSLILNSKKPPLYPEFDKLFSKAEKETEKKADNSLHDEILFRQKMKIEEERHLKLRTKFLELFPGKTIDSYTCYWFSNVYGQAINNLKDYDLNFSVFSKSALFDLEESNWLPAVAVKIGIGKKNKMVFENDF